jgi:hypothetical protein
MTMLETKPTTPAQQAQHDAREMYRDSLKAQNPLTGVELGKAFKRSERWGRDRIGEVKTEASSPVLPEAAPVAEPTPPAAEAVAELPETEPHLPLFSEPTGSAIEPTPPTPESLRGPRPATSLPPVTAETAETLPSAQAEETVKPWWRFRKRQAAASSERTMPKPEATPRAAALPTPERPVLQAQAAPKAAVMTEPAKSGGKPRGRLIAWTTMAVGITVSMGANVGHIVFVIGPTMPDGPSPWSMGLAAFWPLSLFLAIEVITKVSWPSSLAFTLTRYLAVGGIALVAAWVSYWHMHGLLDHWGEDALSAYVGPLGVDGLVIIGGIALAAIRQSKAESE